MRKLMSALGTLVLLSTMAPLAHAGIVYFNLPGLHLGQSPRVAEQIICASVGCSGLDYQSYVLNTGAVGIDGVALGLDITAANYAAAIAGAFTFASAAGEGDSGFPALTGCAIGVCGGTTGFEEWQDGGTAALPATLYITVRYPAGGTWAVDPAPFHTVPSLEFEGLNGHLNIDPNMASDWAKPCDPSGGNTSCTPGTAASDSQFAAGAFQQDLLSEHASMLLTAGGILMLAACGVLMLAVRELRRAGKP